MEIHEPEGVAGGIDGAYGGGFPRRVLKKYRDHRDGVLRVLVEAGP
jgi:hypothetical protein